MKKKAQTKSQPLPVAATPVAVTRQARSKSAAAAAAPKRWMLYLIECANGALYAGITNDLVRRYAMHASGKGARYTRANPPVRLVAFRRYADKSAALRAEHAVRQLSAGEKPAFVRGKRPHRATAAVAALMTAAATRKVVARRDAPTTEVSVAAGRAGAKDTCGS